MDSIGLAPRVLLIDDHPLFRQALAATVRQARADARIEEYVTLAEARAALGEAAAFVFLDLRLPDAQGLTGLLALKAQAPDAAIAIVSATDDALTVQGAMACGASGFISKAAGVDELTAAIETLFAGQAFVPEAAAPDASDPLTPAQTRILEAIHRGLMSKQIAWEMGISEATVKYHLTGIFRKLGVQTRAQLLTLARPGG
ncbi:MAG TPA: response regulator transcription factor [Novosphingobium sp.]|nr:response regulator transcription factor [Novosphingobium sp.]